MRIKYVGEASRDSGGGGVSLGRVGEAKVSSGGSWKESSLPRKEPR